MSNFFDERGYIAHPSIERADRTIVETVSSLCDELISDGITKVELRALSGWLVTAVITEVCGAIIMKDIKQREEEKDVQQLQV